LFIPGIVLQLICIFSLPLSGIFAYNYYIWIKKFKGKLRFSFLLRKKNNQVYYLVQTQKEIVTLMDKLVTKYINQKLN